VYNLKRERERERDRWDPKYVRQKIYTSVIHHLENLKEEGVWEAYVEMKGQY